MSMSDIFYLIFLALVIAFWVWLIQSVNRIVKHLANIESCLIAQTRREQLRDARNGAGQRDGESSLQSPVVYSAGRPQ